MYVVMGLVTAPSIALHFHILSNSIGACTFTSLKSVTCHALPVCARVVAGRTAVMLQQ